MPKFLKNLLTVLLPAYFSFYTAKLIYSGGTDIGFTFDPLQVIDQFLFYLTIKFTGNEKMSYYIGIAFFVVPSYIALFIKLSLSKKSKREKNR